MLRRPHQLGCHMQSCNVPTPLLPIRPLDQCLTPAPEVPYFVNDRAVALSFVAIGNIASGPAGREHSLGLNRKRGQWIPAGPAHTHIDFSSTFRPNQSAAISADSLTVLPSIQSLHPRSEVKVIGQETAAGHRSEKVIWFGQCYRTLLPITLNFDPYGSYSRIRPSPPIKASTADHVVSSRQVCVAPGAFRDTSTQRTPAPAATDGIAIPGIRAPKIPRRRNCQSRDPPTREYSSRPLLEV